MSNDIVEARLRRRDYILLSIFCLFLFGFSLVGGRPLSMHEAVLPQSAREMLNDGELAVPKRGGAPWLESPPLPQWITVAVASVFGRCDEVWIVRLPGVLMATSVVLMVGWMASLWFGRTTGLLSGFIMATTAEFTRYAWLAEDEIYLCAIVTAAIALFVRIEFSASGEQINERNTAGAFRFFGRRTRLTLLFFAVLGMTNLVKGLIFGTAMAVIPIAGFLLWNADFGRIRRYLWSWGWLAFLVVASLWPVVVYIRYPNVLELWKFDLGGRLGGHYVEQSIWYYPVNLLWILAPWTLVIPFGFLATRKAALKQRYSAERFLWVWALLIPIVFSIPHGKHHHYLLHAIVPWSVLASFGLVSARKLWLSAPRLTRTPAFSVMTVALPGTIALWIFRDKLPGPDLLPYALMLCSVFLAVSLNHALLHRAPQFAAKTLFCFVGVCLCFGHWYAGQYVDKHRHDAAFIQSAKEMIERDSVVLVDMQTGGLQGFLYLFYLDDRAVPMHNLSFVRDADVKDGQVYLITRMRFHESLSEFGQLEPILQSQQTANEESAEDRLTLFRLTYHPDVERISSAGTKITPMQAMYRADGPYLGRRL